MVIEQLIEKNVEVIAAQIDVLYNIYLKLIWKNTRTSVWIANFQTGTFGILSRISLQITPRLLSV